MSSKLPESYLFGFRPDRPNDPAIEKAIRTIERDPELKRRLDEQAEFDRQVARTIHAIAPPAGLREMLGSANGRSPVKGKRFVIPLLAAVICGVSILIGLMVVFAIDRHDRFPGSEAVAQMVGTGKTMTGAELEQVSNKAGRLGDWFYMQGFEAYWVPPELAEAPALGSRIFRQDGNSVAQVAIEWHHSILYIFRADEFGVDLPQNEDWRLLKYDDWAAAVKKRGGICTLIAFRGEKSEMRDFLKSLEKK